MDPRDFCSLALALVQDGGTEATPVKCRTAISRAYFAAYNAVIETLAHMGIHILGQGADKHVIVREYMNNSGDHRIRAAKKELNDLHEDRKASDYLDYQKSHFDPENPETALGCIEIANNIIQTLSIRSKDPQVIKAMQEHHRLRSTTSSN